MKRKAIPALCAAGLLALALSGCGGGAAGSQAEYIGIDAAKALALEAAGVSESAATFSTAGLDRRNGMDYYAVDFTAGGQSYEYDIDAVTGVVIDSNTGSGTAETPAGGAAETPAATPSPSAGQAAAGQTSAGQTGSANTGSANTGTTAGSITADRAKEIALSHAGLTADQATFVRSHLDWDDGRQVYDVEFYDGSYTEYDYEIDANTGDVISYDYDAEFYSYQPNAATGATTASITADQAKSIALAEVPGATTSDIYEFEVDRDDGRIEYEGKIIYNNVEYEFTIDGYSGAIRGWESEPFRW